MPTGTSQLSVAQSGYGRIGRLAADMLARLADSLRFGVPHIWIADPYKRTLQEPDREGIRACPGLVIATDMVGRVDFNELFAELDEPE